MMRGELIIIQEMIDDTNNGFYSTNFLFDFAEQYFENKYYCFVHHLDDWLDENNKRITDVDVELYFIPKNQNDDFRFSIDLLNNGSIKLNTNYFLVIKFENVTDFKLTIKNELPNLHPTQPTNEHGDSQENDPNNE